MSNCPFKSYQKNNFNFNCHIVDPLNKITFISYTKLKNYLKEQLVKYRQNSNVAPKMQEAQQ